MQKDFYNKPALVVAPALLGKFLVRKIGRKEVALMITEVEAYTGPEDKASHAFHGRTDRTNVMFGPPGHWYVYLVYGMHWMLNVVVDREETPAAVLIRGGLLGDMLFDGPGKLTKQLVIDGSLNAKKVTRSSGLWIEDRGVRVATKDITCTPRIGVAYAEEWAEKPYRFVMKQ